MADISLGGQSPDAIRLAIVKAHIQAENARDVAATVATWNLDSPLFVDTAANLIADTQDDITAAYVGLFNAFPDLQIVSHIEHCCRDVIVVEVTMSGTHREEWQGIAATNRRMTVPVCALFYFNTNNELTCEKIYYDRLTLLEQLGIGAAA